MEYQKFTVVLGAMPEEVPRFITTKQKEVHDQSGSGEDKCKPSKQIRFKTLILRSDLCGFSDAYIVAKGGITLTKDADRGFIDMRSRSLAFKNNAPFTNFISKINSISVGNA